MTNQMGNYDTISGVSSAPVGPNTNNYSQANQPYRQANEIPNNNQYYLNPNDNNYPKDANDIEGGQIGEYNIETSLRIGFIRKVYGILSIQLLITVLMASLTFIPVVKAFCLTNIWLFWVCLILSIVIIIPLLCFRDIARSYPMNYALLVGWTICESYMVAVCCSTYDPQIVITAAALTCAVTLGLTYYACTTKTDFTWMGGLLFVCLVVMLFFGILAFFIPILKLVYCIFGVLLYSIYLIYDTQLIMGKFGNEYEIDDYIIAAIMVYIDIIQIFLYLLQILGGNR